MKQIVIIAALLSASVNAATWVPLNVPEITDAKYFYDRDTITGKVTTAGGGVDVRILTVLKSPDPEGAVEIVQRKAYYCNPAMTGNRYVNITVKTWRYGAGNQQRELEIINSDRQLNNSALNPVDRAAVGRLCSSVTGQMNEGL